MVTNPVLRDIIHYYKTKMGIIPSTGGAPITCSPPLRVHFIQLLQPLNDATLGTKLLAYEPLGDKAYQTIPHTFPDGLKTKIHAFLLDDIKPQISKF
jgi:hypothetical protein